MEAELTTKDFFDLSLLSKMKRESWTIRLNDDTIPLAGRIGVILWEDHRNARNRTAGQKGEHKHTLTSHVQHTCGKEIACSQYSLACSLVRVFISPDVLYLQEHQSRNVFLVWFLSNIQYERIFVKRAMEKELSTTHHQANSATFVISGCYRKYGTFPVRGTSSIE
ncbi:hypothetical protein CBL_03944 [Carabus blaptoides fortunei]